jgi:hypothetical protein
MTNKYSAGYWRAFIPNIIFARKIGEFTNKVPFCFSSLVANVRQGKYYEHEQTL